MSTDADPWISALRSSHERLLTTVPALDEDTLGQPSMCADWTIAQVLSHIGSGAEIGLALLRATVDGTELPGMEANTPIWDRWNARSATEAAADVGPADAALVEAFEALRDDQRSELRIQMPFLPDPIDVATAVAFRLSEHALHTWDVIAALDPTVGLAADATELLIDRMPWTVEFVGRFTPRETRPADPVTISITTTDPTRHYRLELGDGAELREDAPGETDGTLAIPAEALVRLIAGRLGQGTPAAASESTGPLTMAGLRAAFPGY